MPTPSAPARRVRGVHVQRRTIAVYRREPRRVFVGRLECINHGLWSGSVEGGGTAIADTAEECADKLTGVWHLPMGS
jgi:hypothetical protein